MLMSHVNGCHGNHATVIVRMCLSLGKMLCISGVPKNVWKSMKNCPGCFKVGQISPQGMLICNKLERFIYVNNTNCFKRTIYGTAAMCCYY